MLAVNKMFFDWILGVQTNNFNSVASCIKSGRLKFRSFNESPDIVRYAFTGTGYCEAAVAAIGRFAV
jgi:hypothetical protein